MTLQHFDNDEYVSWQNILSQYYEISWQNIMSHFVLWSYAQLIQ